MGTCSLIGTIFCSDSSSTPSKLNIAPLLAMSDDWSELLYRFMPAMRAICSSISASAWAAAMLTVAIAPSGARHVALCVLQWAFWQSALQYCCCLQREHVLRAGSPHTGQEAASL